MLHHRRRRASEPNWAGAVRLPAPQAPSRHLVLVAVDHVDQRVLDLCGRAVAQPGVGVQVVCLADDVAACRETVGRWRRLHATEVPIDVVDAENRWVATAIREQIDANLHGGWDHVTVLVPHLVVPWPWRLLHNHTSNAVVRSLRNRPHVDVVRVPMTPRPPLR